MAKSFFSITTCLIIAFVPVKLTGQNASTLNGTWVPIKQEIGGKTLPFEAFKSQSLIISDSTYIFNAESTDKGSVRYNNGRMDIYGRDGVNKGRHFMAIYKIENELLFVCYNLAGTGYPNDFVTGTNPVLFLSIFKKELIK